MKTFVYMKTLVLVPVLFLSGCTTSVWEAKWGANKPHISFIQLDTKEGTVDKLYVWNPNNNAAYIFNDNNISVPSACMASADVATVRNYDNDFKIDLGKVFNDENVSIQEKLKIVDTMTKLTEKGESASFLNVAMFHICMMAGSGKITPSEANILMNKAIDKAVEVAKTSK
jgi:hypothetical protein